VLNARSGPKAPVPAAFDTVNVKPLLPTPPTVTTTFPVVAPAGTVAVMLVVLHAVAVAAMPLNVTVLVPCVAPKFAPVIVTELPTAPEVGFKLVTLAGGGFPPPEFELLAEPHPIFVMASASKSTGSPIRRKTSPDVLDFIIDNIGIRSSVKNRIRNLRLPSFAFHSFGGDCRSDFSKHRKSNYNP
jgi:hypothetical protein